MISLVLSKADLLNGKDSIKEFEFPELGGSISLRPLTDGEFQEVQAVKVSGGKLEGAPVVKNGEIDPVATQKAIRVQMDLGETQKKEFEGDCLAVAYSLSHSGETWTPDEVRNLKPIGIVTRIAEKVYEISGIKEGIVEDVKNFRKRK